MAPKDMDKSIARAAQIVRDADAIIIAAGAGMGVDSGLPDFRGNPGFWVAYPALAAEGAAFMDIASPAAFHGDLRRQARCPAVIEIGADVNVATVRHFADRVVLRHKGSVIRINPREPHVSHLHGVGIAVGAQQALAAIHAVLSS